MLCTWTVRQAVQHLQRLHFALPLTNAVGDAFLFKNVAKGSWGCFFFLVEETLQACFCLFDADGAEPLWFAVVSEGLGLVSRCEGVLGVGVVFLKQRCLNASSRACKLKSVVQWRQISTVVLDDDLAWHARWKVSLFDPLGHLKVLRVQFHLRRFNLQLLNRVKTWLH